jgi:Uma2 family endonuclease
VKPQLVSVEEYLAGELVSEVKHEYLGGRVHAMAGGTTRHSAVATNVTTALGGALRGKRCRPFNNDLKVRIELPGQTRFYYPDAMIVCELRQDSETWQDRPVVIVEVLSESTRRTDLTEKREAYLAIPTLKALIFVEPDFVHATVHRRGPSGGFVNEEYLGLEAVIPLPEVEIELPLAEVYEGLGV